MGSLVLGRPLSTAAISATRSHHSSAWIGSPAVGVRFSSTIPLPAGGGDRTEKPVMTGSVGDCQEEMTVPSYWGVAPPKIKKEDGTEWKWSCFRVIFILLFFFLANNVVLISRRLIKKKVIFFAFLGFLAKSTDFSRGTRTSRTWRSTWRSITCRSRGGTGWRVGPWSRSGGQPTFSSRFETLTLS